MNTVSPRTRMSTFSENLTTLESLVLEVALEDANQMSPPATSNSPLEMSEAEYRAIASLEGNDQCADCGADDTEWASVTFGTLLCAECSGIHR